MTKTLEKFFKGMGSLLDLSPEPEIVRPDFSEILDKSDTEKLSNDWVNVGNDLRWALNAYEKEQAMDGEKKERSQKE